MPPRDQPEDVVLRLIDDNWTASDVCFRRTLVGLKHDLGREDGRGNEFQTNPRGVEAPFDPETEFEIVFQTNPRGVEANRKIDVVIVQASFRRTLVGLKLTYSRFCGCESQSFRRTLVGLKRTVVGLLLVN